MKIKFMPTGQVVENDPNKTLLQICNDNKIEIKSLCKGIPSCAECRVKIVEGEHNILPPSKAELNLIGSSYFVDQRRLSCQVRCFGDLVVDITEQIERAEFQTKKVRGFRTPGQKGSYHQTHAKQGTLVLEEAQQPQKNGDQQQGQQPRKNNR
jgi:2Fe-2S ferredoxin